jgi:predicted DNA-binding transcriptional regulator AlpA
MILDRYLSQDELAAELGITVATLLNWRRDGKAPPHTRIGQRVVYARDSVEKWLRDQEQDPARAKSRASAA